MQGIDFSQQLLIRRTANVRVIVTPRWKEEMQQQLQAQVSQIDMQIQQIEAQGQRMIMEIERQSLKPLPAEVAREIENIRLEMNRRKAEGLEQKNQLLQQLNQVQVLELEQEVIQGQIDTYCPVGKGDNLIATMQVDVVLRDGVIEEIRTGFPPIVQVE
ncbi:MAG: YlqD family protein [Pseudanabaenaceae cyanobacterium]